MTSDVRQLLRSAAAAEFTDVGARAAVRRGLWLRWQRRVMVAVSVACAGVVIVSLASGGRFIVGDAKDITPAQRPTEAGSGHDRRPRSEPSPASEAGAARSAEEKRRRQNDVSRSVRPPLTACNPLIDDQKSDVADGSIDILTSSITYDENEHALIFRHTIRDIAIDPTVLGEGPFYDLGFTWNGERYSAVAYVTSSGGQEFSVVRAAERPPVGTDSAVSQTEESNATGHIDADTDTVELHLNLEKFNRTEPSNLKVGSKLRNIELVANPRGSSWSTQQHETDVASAECDYVVG